MAAPFVPMLALLTIVIVTLSNTKSAQAAIMVEPTRMTNNKRDDSTDETNARNTIKVCVGSNLTLDVDQSLLHGNEVKVVEWFFTPINTSSSVFIAAFLHGSVTIEPAYSSRLNHLDHGNFVLSGVTLSDAGTYMAYIITDQKTRSLFASNRELVVTVADPASYRSNKLTLTMDQHAVFVNTSANGGDVHIQLKYGPLTWRGEPPIIALLKIPSLSYLWYPSTYFKDGFYFFRLSNPVDAGVYTSSLQDNAATSLCLHYDDLLLRTVTLQLNAKDIRLVLLEGEVKRLKEKQSESMKELKEELEEVKGELKKVSEEVKKVTKRHM